jgi:hypothetical protein
VRERERKRELKKCKDREQNCVFPGARKETILV